MFYNIHCVKIMENDGGAFENANAFLYHKNLK